MSAVVLTDRPAGYWRLGERSGIIARDASGHALAGSYEGAPALGGPGPFPGDPSRAVVLDGATQYITVPDDALLDFPDPDVFTLEAWVKPDALVFSFIISKNANGYELVLLAGGQICLNKSEVANMCFSAVSLVAGRWTHVVATKNGPAMKLYFDGIDVTGATANATVTATAAELTIGRHPAGVLYFAGALANVAVYPAALAPIRASAHFLEGRFPFGHDFGAIYAGAAL